MSFCFSRLPECLKPGNPFFVNCTSRGAVNLIPSTAQRRRGFEIVISGLIIPTYLQFFLWHGQGLSQEPSWRTYLFSTIWYIYSTRLSQSGHMFVGLHTRSELRCKLAHSGIWHFFTSIFGRWYLIPTGDLSICRMSTEHQLLILFFHWTLDGLGFWFWGRCHDRCIPQQNSRSCFSSSVCACVFV